MRYTSSHLNIIRFYFTCFVYCTVLYLVYYKFYIIFLIKNNLNCMHTHTLMHLQLSEVTYAAILGICNTLRTWLPRHNPTAYPTQMSAHSSYEFYSFFCTMIILCKINIQTDFPLKTKLKRLCIFVHVTAGGVYVVTNGLENSASSRVCSNIYPTRCNVIQFIISENCSACFGWYHHPSSRAHSTVSTASGICHTLTAICLYRGSVGTDLSVLWVAYATHSTLKPVPTLPR